jgi:2-polyprenyl-6-hydroxyphenyl methylase/3-demethylubiquinone-9 3-methyltransferase
MYSEASFSFGKNWKNFLKGINEDKIKNAESSIIDFLGLKDLKNKSFLDIGCGSGIFSFGALNLGAKKIVSFDIDSFSVECCNYFYNKAYRPENWRVIKGSILDDNFILNLGNFDVVYAWGVLHHTGQMWKSIRNSLKLVNKGGYYYLAIYNKVDGWKGSDFWLKVKRIYNHSPKVVKYSFEFIYMLAYFVVNFLKLESPIKKIKNYKSGRGMSWRRDITDWFGGYPYEYATVKEILNFMDSNFPRFKLVNIKRTEGLENNWFLYKRIL